MLVGQRINYEIKEKKNTHKFTKKQMRNKGNNRKTVIKIVLLQGFYILVFMGYNKKDLQE